MDERLEVLIFHIRDVAAEISAFVGSTDRADIEADVFVARGLVMSLYMIADLATRLQSDHPSFVATLPDIPWNAIRGLRNRIAHGYFEIDTEIVWRAAVEDVPVLAQALVGKLDAPQIGS